MTYDASWVRSAALDELTKGMKSPMRMESVIKTPERSLRDEKSGRNDPCLYGSRKKYKKCSLSSLQGLGHFVPHIGDFT